MVRVCIIILSYLSMFFAFNICAKWDKGSVDVFDLLRHNGYYITIALWVFHSYFEVKFPKLEILLKEVLIYGVLLTCFTHNLQQVRKPVEEMVPLDRDFHWYSVLYVIIGLTLAHIKIYPEKYKHLWPRKNQHKKKS